MTMIKEKIFNSLKVLSKRLPAVVLHSSVMYVWLLHGSAVKYSRSWAREKQESWMNPWSAAATSAMHVGVARLGTRSLADISKRRRGAVPLLGQTFGQIYRINFKQGSFENLGLFKHQKPSYDLLSVIIEINLLGLFSFHFS